MKKKFLFLLLVCSCFMTACRGADETGSNVIVQAIWLEYTEGNYTATVAVYWAEAGETELLKGEGAGAAQAYGQAVARFAISPHLGHLEAVVLSPQIIYDGNGLTAVADVLGLAGCRNQALLVAAPGEAFGGDVQTWLQAANEYLQAGNGSYCQLLTPFNNTSSDGSFCLPMVEQTEKEITRQAFLVAKENAYCYTITQNMEALALLVKQGHTLRGQAGSEGLSYRVTDACVSYDVQQEEESFFIKIIVMGKLTQPEAGKKQVEAAIAEQMEQVLSTVLEDGQAELAGLLWHCAQKDSALAQQLLQTGAWGKSIHCQVEASL